MVSHQAAIDRLEYERQSPLADRLVPGKSLTALGAVHERRTCLTKLVHFRRRPCHTGAASEGTFMSSDLGQLLDGRRDCPSAILHVPKRPRANVGPALGNGRLATRPS